MTTVFPVMTNLLKGEWEKMQNEDKNEKENEKDENKNPLILPLLPTVLELGTFFAKCYMPGAVPTQICKASLKRNVLLVMYAEMQRVLPELHEILDVMRQVEDPTIVTDPIRNIHKTYMMMITEMTVNISTFCNDMMSIFDAARYVYIQLDKSIDKIDKCFPIIIQAADDFGVHWENSKKVNEVLYQLLVRDDLASLIQHHDVLAQSLIEMNELWKITERLSVSVIAFTRAVNRALQT